MQFTTNAKSIECKPLHSPHKIYLSPELFDLLGGESGVIEKFKAGIFSTNLFPRRSSINHPWTITDWNFYQKNMEIGRRHWVYNSNCIVGSTSYHGYGFKVDGGFQFWNPSTDTPAALICGGRSSY